MKALTLSLLSLATLFPANTRSQTLDAGKLTGSWSGSGTFFKADLQSKAGPLHFTMVFKPDHSGTGRVGGATMENVRVKSSRGHLEVDAKLVGAIGTDPALAKDQIVLLVTQVGDSTLTAEFHLKSNSVLDLRMREGRVVLTRTQ